MFHDFYFGNKTELTRVFFSFHGAILELRFLFPFTYFPGLFNLIPKQLGADVCLAHQYFPRFRQIIMVLLLLSSILLPFINRAVTNADMKSQENCSLVTQLMIEELVAVTTEGTSLSIFIKSLKEWFTDWNLKRFKSWKFQNSILNLASFLDNSLNIQGSIFQR